jgi:outer membrane protein assembly factor BamB
MYGVKESNTYSSPLIEGNVLILMVGGERSATVIALNKETGEEVWKALDEPGGPSSPIVVTAGGTRQLIVWTPNSLTSLGPLTGKMYWTERLSTPGSQAVATPVFHKNLLLVSGLMFKLEDDRPAASILWPKETKVSARILSNISTPIFQGDYVYSGKTSGELVCLEAATGKQRWTTDKVTELAAGACIHIASDPDGMFLFTDRGELIRSHLAPTGYQEVRRLKLIEPINDYLGRKVIWTPPAFANGDVFARDDRALICCSLTQPR